MDDYNKKIRKISLDELNDSKNLNDKIKMCLKLASLAPSVHNVQPWKVKLGEKECEIFVDSSIKLPESDPTTRHLHISIGCFIENLLLTSKLAGIFEKVTFFPNGENGPVAKVFFTNEGIKNSEGRDLVEAIVLRKNIRGPFDTNADISESLANFRSRLNAELKASVNFVDNREQILKIAELTASGMRTAHGRRSFRKEMAGWLINNYSDRNSGMPGYSMNMPGAISLLLPTVLGNFNLGAILSKLNYLSVSSAPMVCVFSSADERSGWIDVGRQIERLMLAATALGLNTSIYVASTEIGDIYQEIKKIINCKDRPQFVLCVGKMKKTPDWFTPRVNIEEKIYE